MKTDIIPTVVIKLQNGEQLIGEITDIPELSAFRVFNPLSLYVSDELQLCVSSFIIGTDCDECIIRKSDILTAVPASLSMIEIYYSVLASNNPEIDQSDDADFDYLSKFGL